MFRNNECVPSACGAYCHSCTTPGNCDYGECYDQYAIRNSSQTCGGKDGRNLTPEINVSRPNYQHASRVSTGFGGYFYSPVSVSQMLIGPALSGVPMRNIVVKMACCITNWLVWLIAKVLPRTMVIQNDVGPNRRKKKQTCVE